MKTAKSLPERKGSHHTAYEIICVKRGKEVREELQKVVTPTKR